MLDSVDLGQEPTDKKGYKERRKALVERLVVLQQKAVEADRGVVVLFEGWNGAGKGSRISDILYCLDARRTKVNHSTGLTDEDVQMFGQLKSGVSGYSPFMKPFWDGLGERGAITFFEQGWYSAAEQLLIGTEHARWHADACRRTCKPRTTFASLAEHVLKPRNYLDGASPVDVCIKSIESFERTLTDNGYVVLKFFLHIGKAAQRHRLTGLYSNPATRWRVSDEDLLRMSDYDDRYPLLDTMLERSNFDFAPWHVLNGEDKRGANLTIAETIVEALERVTAPAEKPSPEETAIGAPAFSRFTTQTDYPSLDDVDHGLVLPREEYKQQLKKEQKRLFELELDMYQQRVPLIVMYEGWDAAGKGGSIKRVAQALDARAYEIFPSPAPSRVELAHPHLWRYWTRLPKAGHVGIYDRSWYGRVLVERVENITAPADWARAYDEINEFESDLVDWGALIVKFWVEIDQDEQLRRFQDRQNTPAKQWKITDEDWRNREKYPLYREAVEDMFRLTSTTFAPWHILESNDKPYARVKALKTINDLLEKRLS